MKTIKELIKPERYHQVVTATKCLAGFSDVTGQYQCPSLARKVGYSLHSLALYIKSEGFKVQDKVAVQNADEFARLCQESWKSDIASQALTQLDQAKWNSPQLLLGEYKGRSLDEINIDVNGMKAYCILI